MTSPIVTKIQSLRAAARCARDVRAGTDGDPIAAAKLLAEVVYSIADAITSAAKGPLREKVLEAAPLIVTARLADPQAFEETRGLLEDLGAPGLLDDLPTAWSVPPISAMDAGYGIGFSIGAHAHDAALAAPSGDVHCPEPASIEGMAQAVLETLAENGVDICSPTEAKRASTAVVNKVLDMLGLEIVEPEPPGYMYPATPWEIGTPVDGPLECSIPDHVLPHYQEGFRRMLEAEGLDPRATIHAIFVTDQRLHEIDAVMLIPDDSELLRQAWEGCPDPCGWGPSSERPFAIWYPVVKSAQAYAAARLVTC